MNQNGGMKNISQNAGTSPPPPFLKLASAPMSPTKSDRVATFFNQFSIFFLNERKFQGLSPV